MCGIIGYVGTRDVVPVLIGGLRKLEYRGYDSAGIAVVNGNGVRRRARRGQARRTSSEARTSTPLHGTFGMGHTRWATHGKPNENNAHPHRDCTRHVVVIHNGIIENFLPLKQQLQKRGHEFKTETDTEVVAHLIEATMKDGRSSSRPCEDAQGAAKATTRWCMIDGDEPGTIVAAKQGPPLVDRPRRGRELSSPPTSRRSCRTRATVIYLEDGEYAVVDQQDGCEVFDATASGSSERRSRITWDRRRWPRRKATGTTCSRRSTSSRAPSATRSRGRMFEESGEVFFNDLQLTPDELAKFERVHIVACGTSWHAALVGKFLLEELARIPIEVDYGSEYRYRNPIVDDERRSSSASRSRARRPTRSPAMQEAKKKGAKLITICNVIGAAATRMSRRRDLHERRAGDRRRVDEGVHDAAHGVLSAARSTSAQLRGDDERRHPLRDARAAR